MKTVLFINSVSASYFRRDQGVWQAAEQARPGDKLWVVVNLPEETLDALEVPLLLIKDRNDFLKRHLAAAFPHSQYRTAPMLSGGLIKSGTAVLTGLTSDLSVVQTLEKLNVPITGVWGISMLLTMMAQRLSLSDAIIIMPSAHYLRILVLKDKIPVLTRCIHRYGEGDDSDANEILRTSQHLENRRIFEHDAIPPVLYLGDSTPISDALKQAGIQLLPLPPALAPQGIAAFLHPVFEHVITSPRGQMAPLQLRARHLSEKVRNAAYAGIAISTILTVLMGQDDFRSLIALHAQGQALNARLHNASTERSALAKRIQATGSDPKLVRQATRFAELEMDAAPAPETLFRLVAGLIADQPELRAESLAFRHPKNGEIICQEGGLADMIRPHADDQARTTELKFSIALHAELAPAARTEARKRISAAIKTHPELRLIQDPAAYSVINTLKGGFGMNNPQSENLWCLSLPWHGETP